MSSLGFRLGEAADAPAIRALVERAYRGPEAGEGWASEADLLTGPRTSLAEVSELLADAESRFVLAERAGAIVGCALIQQHAHVGSPAPGEAYFGMFAIAPDAQGDGLGKAVLAEAERQARALWGARSIALTVINLRTELIGWYERRGYVWDGAREPFPFHEHSGALRTDFDLVVMRKVF
jgi:ribosomal protein S18 acetylase RimI-like enzyme